MKTLKLFKFTVAFTITLSLLQSVVLYDSALADAWGREAVKANTATPSQKSSEMTDEERKMGGTTSPYSSCGGLLMVEHGDYVKNKTYWEKRRSSCDSKVANCSLTVQVIPDSGVFASRSVTPGVNVSSAVTVGAFLETVRVRASGDLSKAISALETKQNTCFSPKATPSAGCTAAAADINKRVGTELPEFRKAVALMSVPSDEALQRAIVTKDVSGLIDENFASARRSALVPDLEKMTSKERDFAKAHCEKLLAQARKEFESDNEALLAPLKVKGRETDLAAQRSRLNRAENFTFKVKEVFNKSRGEYAALYTAAIGRVPEIAYIGSASASKDVIGAGLATMTKDAKESLARIKKNPANAKDLSAAKVDSSLLQYAAYSQTIDKMLTEEQSKGGASNCAVATAAYNQLKTVEGRNAGYATAAIVGASVAFAVAPWAAGAMGTAMSTGAAALSANLAVASGLIGGFAMTAYDVNHAANIVQDGRSGLVNAKDVEEARTAAGIGILASPLNFVGAGALVGGTVSAAALAAKSTIRSFGANAVAKGAVKVAGTTAEDVTKLATTAATVAGKAGTAAAASSAKKEVTSEALALAGKLDEAGDKGAAAVLKRESTASDEKAFSAMANANMLGDEKTPNFAVANTYASITQSMPESARAKFADDLKKIADVVAEGRKAAAAAGKSEAVAPVNGELALAIAQGAPDVKAAAAVLRADSGYDATAQSGVLEVWKAATALAKGAGAKSKEAVETRVRQVLAKFKGEKPDSPGVTQLCRCMAACPVPVKAANDPFESLTAPAYVACTTH